MHFWCLGAHTGSGWASRAADIHLPVVEGAAHDRVLPGLQHHITAHKLLHRSLAVCQQPAQGQLVAAAERGAENHDAQVEQVAVGRVRTPKMNKLVMRKRIGMGFLCSGDSRTDHNEDKMMDSGVKYKPCIATIFTFSFFLNEFTHLCHLSTGFTVKKLKEIERACKYW